MLSYSSRVEGPTVIMHCRSLSYIMAVISGTDHSCLAMGVAGVGGHAVVMHCRSSGYATGVISALYFKRTQSGGYFWHRSLAFVPAEGC